MAELEDLVAGTLYGAVLIEGQVIPVVTAVTADVRYRALKVLREYLSLITISRATAEGKPPKKFRIPKTSILLEQPDDPKELIFPSIGTIPGITTHEPVGIGPPFVLPETQDQFGKGTVLVQIGEVLETFILELWASKGPERRGLTASIEQAFRPLQESYSLRLRMADYYDHVAEFTLSKTQYIDDADVIRGRRRTHLTIDLRAPEVMLVRYVPGLVQAQVIVEDGSVVIEVSTSG